MTAVAIVHREEIIARVAEGERLTDIAVSLGYKSHHGISMRLAQDPEYKAAREAGAESKLDNRERELEGCAADGVTLARVTVASQLLSNQRWRCEREFPARWGKQPETTINVNVASPTLVSDSLSAIFSSKQAETVPLLQCEDENDSQV